MANFVASSIAILGKRVAMFESAAKVQFLMKLHTKHSKYNNAMACKIAVSDFCYFVILAAKLKNNLKNDSKRELLRLLAREQRCQFLKMIGGP